MAAAGDGGGCVRGGRHKLDLSDLFYILTLYLSPYMHMRRHLYFSLVIGVYLFFNLPPPPPPQRHHDSW